MHSICTCTIKKTLSGYLTQKQDWTTELHVCSFSRFTCTCTCMVCIRTCTRLRVHVGVYINYACVEHSIRAHGQNQMEAGGSYDGITGSSCYRDVWAPLPPILLGIADKTWPRQVTYQVNVRTWFPAVCSLSSLTFGNWALHIAWACPDDDT